MAAPHEEAGMAARSTITTGFATLLAAMVLAGGAGAADMALRGSLPGYEDTGPNWTGIYGGVQGGIGSLNMDTQSMARRETEKLLNGLIYLDSTNHTSAVSYINPDPIRSTPVMLGIFVG